MAKLSHTLAALAVTMAECVSPASATVHPVTVPRTMAAPDDSSVSKAQAECVVRQLPAQQEVAAIAYNKNPQRLLVVAMEGGNVTHLYQTQGANLIYARKTDGDVTTVAGELDLTARDPKKGKEASFSDPANHVTFSAMRPEIKTKINAFAQCLGMNNR
jgi:hypothetical protein